MNRKSVVTASIVIALAAALTASPLWADSYSFKLPEGGSINGTELKAGAYKLELNSQGEAVIYRHGQVVAKAPAEVEPLNNGTTKNSILRAADGSVLEIRLKDEVVVFVR